MGPVVASETYKSAPSLSESVGREYCRAGQGVCLSLSSQSGQAMNVDPPDALSDLAMKRARIRPGLPAVAWESRTLVSGVYILLKYPTYG